MTGAQPPRPGDELPLATRAGRQIPNEYAEEILPELLQEALRLVEPNYPELVRRSVSNTYNCVGMVFAARRVHIDDLEVDAILREDAYIRLNDMAQALEGDVVVYRDEAGGARHVGVVVETGGLVKTLNDNPVERICVLSKWGYGGEYIHRIDYVHEAYGNHYEIWTHRRTV